MATDQVVTRPFLFTAPLKSPAQEAQLISDPSTRDLTEALKGARASLLFVSACAEPIRPPVDDQQTVKRVMQCIVSAAAEHCAA